MTQSLHPAAQQGFSSAAERYQQVRPSYPEALVPWLQQQLGLPHHAQLLDLGSGTRGIKQATTQEVWDQICQHIVQLLKQKQFKQGVIEGVREIGEVLDQYYDRRIDDLENELGNKPIILG